jgi:hypothetical protein
MGRQRLGEPADAAAEIQGTPPEQRQAQRSGVSQGITDLGDAGLKELVGIPAVVLFGGVGEDGP